MIMSLQGKNAAEREFSGQSLGKMFQDVGIVGQARKLAINKAS